eukprot:tig00000411_g568.t1
MCEPCEAIQRRRRQHPPHRPRDLGGPGCEGADEERIYQTEAYVGEVLAEALEPKGTIKREELFVTTKLWNTDHERALVRPACERSLKELGLKYIDLPTTRAPRPAAPRRPIAFAAGEGLFPKDGNDRMRKASVPVRETWEAMEALFDAGLVRTIGVSNFKIRDLEELLSYARINPAVNQVELHPYLAQPKLLDFCTKHGIHLTAYFPLDAQPDNPNAVEPPDDPVIGDIAKRIGKSPALVPLRISTSSASRSRPDRLRLREPPRSDLLCAGPNRCADCASFERAARAGGAAGAAGVAPVAESLARVLYSLGRAEEADALFERAGGAAGGAGAAVGTESIDADVSLDQLMGSYRAPVAAPGPDNSGVPRPGVDSLAGTPLLDPLSLLAPPI